jgi:hypothetical protein
MIFTATVVSPFGRRQLVAAGHQIITLFSGTDSANVEHGAVMPRVGPNGIDIFTSHTQRVIDYRRTGSA